MIPKVVIVFVVLAIFCMVQAYQPTASSNHECVHANTTYGTRLAGDWIAYSEVIRKSSHFFTKTSTEAKYPSNRSRSYCRISSINVENLYRKCKCYKETVQIIDGGLGYGYVSLKMTTEARCPNEHRVTVYTKC